MSYQDEERIKAKKQLEQMEEQAKREAELKEEAKQSIYDEYVSFADKQFTFERRIIEDLPVSIYMPKDFRLMTLEEKEIVFARTKPPKYAYFGDDIPFSMAVNVTESPLKNEQIRTFLNYSSKIIENMVPKAKVLRTYMAGEEEFLVGNAEFLSMGFDGMIYNLMLFASVEEKLLVIDISFENKEKEKMLPLIKEIAGSLKSEVIEDESDHT